MASFQAKIVWKRPIKVENKKYRVITFPPDALQKIPKKNKKIKKIPLWHQFKPKQFGKGQEKKKINIVVLFRSYPTRNKKLKKNSKKIQKKTEK